MLVFYESINNECFSSHFLYDEAVWSEDKCPSCVAMRAQHQIISLTNLEEILRQGHWVKRAMRERNKRGNCYAPSVL